MAKTTNFQHPRTVMFDDETNRMASELTENGRLSVNHVIREAVRHAHQMRVLRIPTCANGHSCHCPHTHNFAPKS